ncbi:MULTISPECIES: ribosome biogenesis GTPase Der [unclassified Sulfurospirillum]|uniref:ribosome biogenesis GTPase Der n=1 Tax=unclassified Sulfurospirillum TaxID=2618290 RepID=UPI000504924E|nr:MULTISPECIES: ribosome biogenesis GTPase Der [unclassified Sulfurospirillum]KFL34062.1 GTP-binding protein Der [Sulfurospirillum sp. SCADC]
MKKIAIIGLPNVGKSSLFNRIAKQRIAITSDFSGTTRDIKSHQVYITEKPCLLLDTGGLDKSTELFENVHTMSMEASKKADIIIMVVDGKMRPSDEERKIFYSLQARKKPIALVINKIDNDKEMERAWEFDEFGAECVFPISVSHNRGVSALLEWIGELLPSVEGAIPPPSEAEEESEEDAFDDEDEYWDNEGVVDDEEEPLLEAIQEEVETNQINIAIIGRVNVGKSSLLNALVGKQRAVVSSVAGTTIDPVDESIEYEDKILNFVDTAGLRRRGKIEGIEKFALMRTKEMLERANIALLVLDTSEPFLELDERIAGLVEENHLACIIVLNKWDNPLADFEKITAEVRDRFKFLSYAPLITVSAKSKQRVAKIKDMILSVYANYSQHIPTRQLNEVIKNATIRHQIPSDHSKIVKIYFATQYLTKPPRIALVMNKPRSLHFSYKRYLANKLRENFNLEGSPILLYPRAKGERDNEQENSGAES